MSVVDLNRTKWELQQRVDGIWESVGPSILGEKEAHKTLEKMRKHLVGQIVPTDLRVVTAYGADMYRQGINDVSARQQRRAEMIAQVHRAAQSG